MKLTTWAVLGTMLLLSACSKNNQAQEPVQYATSAHPAHQVTMANQASANCAQAGGTLALARQLDGSSIGMCQLANGKRCEEWALLRGSCSIK